MLAINACKLITYYWRIIMTKYNLNEKTSVNLGVLTENSMAVYLGLQYDTENNNYDLIIHEGWRGGRLKFVKDLPMIINPRKIKVVQEFHDEQVMGLCVYFEGGFISLFLEDGEVRIISRF